MAKRRAALNRPPERPELQAAFERAKAVVLTDAQLEEQCASFVYGNAPMGSRITKESAARAVNRIRVVRRYNGLWDLLHMLR